MKEYAGKAFRKAGAWLMKGHAAYFIYIAFAALYLGLQMFQGLSFLDIGMYMSGYSHFSSDPYSCYYLGQWFLTYAFSAAWCDMLDVRSFFGLRIMHLALNLLMQTAIYFYLVRYVRRRYVLMGLLLATLSHFGSYTEVNYNDYSAFLLILAVMAYHGGLCKSGGGRLLFLSGMVVGVAVFFRLVNLSFMLLPLWGVFVSLRYGGSLSPGRQLAVFYCGAAVSVCMVLAGVQCGGYMDVLLLTVQDIAGITGNSGDPHGMKNIVISLFTVYKNVIMSFSVIGVLAVLMVRVEANSRGWGRAAMMSLLAVLIVLNIYFWEPSANILFGICLSALALQVCCRAAGSGTARLLLLSLFIPVVFPAGSNGGSEFFGQNICYLPLPVSLSVVFGCGAPLFRGGASAYRRALLWAWLSVCAAMVFTNIKRPMMEDGNRLECRFRISSDVTGPILTTAANASMYNYLLSNAKPYVADGSYMICNFSTPIISIMRCKPFGVFSDVFTSDTMNSRYLKVAHERAGGGGHLPYLLYDLEKPTSGFRHVRRVLLSMGRYHRVWTDGRYELLEPLGVEIAPN